MLINDLTEESVFFGLLRYKNGAPFLLACDDDLEVPALTVVDVDDIDAKERAEARGYPVIVYDKRRFVFPNGWQIFKEKRQLLFTKLFHLMKKFYQLPDDIQVADNIKIHLINDWGEKEDKDIISITRCIRTIFVILSSYIYGGALKKDWFLKYSLSSIKIDLYQCFKDCYFQGKIAGSLVYIWSIAPRDKMLDFYFYEQDFHGELIVGEKS